MSKKKKRRKVIVRNSQKPNNDDQSGQRYGRGQRSRPPKGAFKAMNEGLAAALAIFKEEPDDEVVNIEVIEEFVEDDDGCSDYLYDLPPDVALVGYYGKDLTMLDEAMRGPDAKQ
jgi:hypothetical protein